MNYYEELGLKPSASPSEIRAAYKRIARLLHPDQHSDEELRLAAECQMKRLNQVYETLMDPAKRRAYDSSCPQLLSPFHRFRQHLRPANVVLALALGAAAMLAWRSPQHLETPQTPAHPPQEAETSPGAPQELEADAGLAIRLLRTEIAESRREIQRLRQQHEAALRELETLRAQQARPAPSLPIVEMPQSPAHSAPPTMPKAGPVAWPAADSPSAVSPAPVAQGLEGSWVYVPARGGNARPPGYSAEFVEVVIASEGGILHGRYRARYRIPDRPISPEVFFQFQGKSGGEETIVSWEGPGGAKGEMTLKLLSSDRLQIDWFATHLGSQLGLASGSSLLTRRRGP